MANDYMDQWNINGTMYDIHDKGRGEAEGVATLDSNGKVPDSQLNLGVANGIATLDLNTKIPNAQLNIGVANGMASLDANGRVPYSQLPESAVEFKGYWNANTNTPQLADGTGTKGDFYFVDTAGSQNLGSGTQYFAVGDRVLYDGTIWKNIASGSVRTINGSGPDAQGNISGIVKSISGKTPNSSGAVSGIVTSVNGITPNSSGAVSGLVSKVNNTSPDSSGNVVITASFSDEDKAVILGPRTGRRYKAVYEKYESGSNIQPTMMDNITYGDGKYVAYMRRYNGTAYYGCLRYSVDLEHWTDCTLPISLLTNYSHSYLFYLDNLGFVFYGYYSSTDYLLTSTDGVNWTNVTSNINNYPTALVKSVDGVSFCKWGSYDNTNNFKVTKDKGSTWETMTQPTAGTFMSLQEPQNFSNDHSNFIHAYNGWYAMIADNSGVNHYLIGSEDGVTWYEITKPTSGSFYSIGYGDNYVYIGGNTTDHKLYYFLETSAFTTTPSWSNAYMTEDGNIQGFFNQTLILRKHAVYMTHPTPLLDGFVENFTPNDSVSHVYINNGLLIVSTYDNSSYKEKYLKYSEDGIHFYFLPITAICYKDISGDTYRQMRFAGFLNGRWIFYFPYASATNKNAPFLVYSALEKDFEEMV